MAWLRTMNFADKWLQESFEEYHAEVITLMDKVQRIEAKILELCKDDEVREKIDALVCISPLCQDRCRLMEGHLYEVYNNI